MVRLLLLCSSLLLTLSPDPTARSTAAEVVVDLCSGRQTPRTWETSLKDMSPPFTEARCVVIVGVSAQSSHGKALEHLHTPRFFDRKRSLQQVSSSGLRVRNVMLSDFVGAFLLLVRRCGPNTSDCRGVWVHEIEPVACRIPDQDLRRAALGVHCGEPCVVFGVCVTIRKRWCECIRIPSDLKLK